jgi:hypothetical protein
MFPLGLGTELSEFVSRYMAKPIILWTTAGRGPHSSAMFSMSNESGSLAQLQSQLLSGRRTGPCPPTVPTRSPCNALTMSICLGMTGPTNEETRRNVSCRCCELRAVFPSPMRELRTKSRGDYQEEGLRCAGECVEYVFVGREICRSRCRTRADKRMAVYVTAYGGVWLGDCLVELSAISMLHT